MLASMTRVTTILLVSTVLGTTLTSFGARALSVPDDFCTGDPCLIDSNKTADSGIILDFGTRAVELSEILTIGDDPMTGSPGSLTILAGSFSIVADGQVKGPGGPDPAGTITIETTGDIRVDGTRSTGAFRLPGTDGGVVNLTAGGDVYGAGKFNLDRDSIAAGGGELIIIAGGNVDLSGDIIAEGAVQGFGGTIDISADGTLDLSGAIRLRGGESGGGSLDLFSTGDMTVAEIDISAGGEFGDAGIGDILALGTLAMNGALVANGADNGENCGDAGDLDITTDGDITITATFDMRGQGLDCSGGFLAIDGQAVTVTGELDLSSNGIEGVGGDLDISSTGNMLIAANLRVDGPDGGGDILLTSDADMSIGGDINASGFGTFGSGASLVELDSSGTLVITGDILAFGGSQGSGGDVALDACTILQTGSSVIDVRAPGGLIGILASDSLTLNGTFFGEPTTIPAIDLRYGPTADPPTIGLATFNVPPTLLLNPLLMPCVLCGSHAECADSNPCTDDICDPATGCSNPGNTDPCDDGDACTTGDFCAFGFCLSITPVVCDDSDACTDDTCDSLLGCQTSFNTAPCDDLDTCTENDTCSAGTCGGSLIDCEDGNPCTDNTCTAGACQSIDNTATCDDGDACTTSDTCSGGACGGSLIDCEDGNPCTDNTCTAGACQSIDNTVSCDDGDACTTSDTCSGGSCDGSLIDCDDGNPCTDNTCTAGACQSVDNTAGCDDGDACTTSDTCGGGSCLGGAPPACGDTDPCTNDFCDSGSGCVNDPIVGCFDSDGDGVIDDEDVCTTLDWTATPLTPPNQHPSKLRLNLKKLSEPLGEQGVLFKAFFNVAEPAQPIAAETDGIHFSLADSSGVFYDINIPGGAVGDAGNCGSRDGWSVALGGKPRWKYANKSGALPPGCVPGSARGVSSIQIKDVRFASKAALQVKVKIKNGDLDRIPSTPLSRVQANLVLAAEPAPGQSSSAAVAGQCAEGVITGSPISGTSPQPFCKAKFRSAALDKVTCKGQ